MKNSPQSTINDLIDDMYASLAIAEKGLISKSDYDSKGGEESEVIQVVDDNLWSVIGWMRTNHIKEIIATYSGGGDTGEAYEVVFDGQQNSTDFIVTRNQKKITRLDDLLNNNYYAENADEIQTVESLISEKITFDFIGKAGHSGFWNLDGGNGTFTINDNGMAKINHIDYSNEDEQSDEVILYLTNETVGKQLMLLSQWIVSNHLENVSLSFSGSGDSVDYYEVSVSGLDEIEIDQESLSNLTLIDGTQINLVDFMEYFGVALINEADHEDYQISGDDTDGGSGELVITADGQCTVNMTYRVNTEKNYRHIFKVDPSMIPEITTVSKRNAFR